MHFGFESYALPSIDRDLDCYYYRNVPLTLGNFMNFDLLIHRMAERQIARYKTISSSRTLSGSKGDIDCIRHRQTPAEPAATGSADASSPLGQSREENLDESVDVLLSSFAINNPYQELTNLTLAMLQNTAFGPLATGSPSTGGNVPSFEFWPHPYQISFFTHTDTDATATPTVTPTATPLVSPASGRHRSLNLAADALPECSVKPIGYEAKCKSADDRDPRLVKHQEQQTRHQMENGDMWLPWAYHGRPHCANGNNNSGSNNNNNNNNCSIDSNPNSIVESIKCIWKRNRPLESSIDSWPNCWGNSPGGSSIWSVVQPHLHLQQHHQQYQQHQQQQQQPQHLQHQEDQRTRALMSAAQLHGCHINQSHGQQVATAGPAATPFNGNHYINNNNNNNRNFGNYNARMTNNNRLQYQQQQQLRQQQQQQQQQMQYVRYNYQNQGLQQKPQLQQEQQLQLAPWQWQQHQNRLGQKPRPHFYPTRFFKSSSNNNLGRKHNKNCFCNGRFPQAANSSSNTNGNNNNPNVEQFMVNLTQEDLEATQMYAIHGERFFEMPMGRRYRRSMYPPTLAAAAPTQLQLQPPDVFHGNWQSRAMPMVGLPLVTIILTGSTSLFIRLVFNADGYSSNNCRPSNREDSDGRDGRDGSDGGIGDSVQTPQESDNGVSVFGFQALYG